MTKLAGSADWHLTGKCPENRKDDYHETQFKKVEFAYNYAMDNNIIALLVSGDLFDKHTTPLWVIEKYIRLFSQRGKGTNCFPLKILVVFGQHDQVHHTSDKENTPLGVVLAACPNMMLLGSEPITIGPKNNLVDIYGAGWGQDIPTPLDKDRVNVLVTHRMVIFEKLWEAQEDFELAHKLLADNPEYDLIVSGDNHQTFVYSYRGRTLINPGSLMRSTSAQLGHTPCFFVWDSVEKKNQRIDIPIRPSEEVFNVEKLEKEKERDVKLDAFIEGLVSPEETEVGMDFKENMDVFLNRQEVPDSVKNIIYEAMRED